MDNPNHPQFVAGAESDLSSSAFPPSELGERPVFLRIDEVHAGQRLDNFLFNLLKGVPKQHVYKIIRKGEVRLNKGRVKQTTRIAAGDVLRVPPLKLDARASSPDAKVEKGFQFLLDTVLFEDDALLVLNKPSGIAVHSGSGIKVGAIEALRSLRTDLAYLELAHRLDRETSGVLVFAKKSSVLRRLNAVFAARGKSTKGLRKQYLALVQGFWRHGRRAVNKPLDTQARRGGERYVTVSQAGLEASSIFNPIARSEAASLVEVEILTGRTHQVRVHAQSEGHPLAGDSRYGDAEFNRHLREKYKLKRLFLHAQQLHLPHPISGINLELVAPLPADLETVLQQLNLVEINT